MLLELTQCRIPRYSMPAKMNEEEMEVEPNNELSELDKAYITLNYPREDPSTGWTVAYALEVAGVDREQRESMLHDYRTDGWSKLRGRLGRWSDGIRNPAPSRHAHTRSLPNIIENHQWDRIDGRVCLGRRRCGACTQDSHP
jgi:hypothetical protein